MKSAEYWIEHLNLNPHPEGGYYNETYRAAEKISVKALPTRFEGDRNFGTAIYFLLSKNDRSLFHRIKSDELWHFHAGDSLNIHVLTSNGLTTHRLGINLELGDQPQVVVPANHWFGASVCEKGAYALASCTVSPGFDFGDFELAIRNELLLEYPNNKEIIERFTKH
jgi:predicted cupin superfamily sugar epimerase